MQLGVVLEMYEDEVIRRVGDPRTGIQRRIKFPPSIAEVVEACEAEAASIATKKRYAAMPTPKPRALIEGPRIPQNRGNVLVGPFTPQYAAMVERARTGDPLDSRYDEKGRGIWVPITWFHENETHAKQGFRPFTVDDLKAIYARNDAAPEAAE